MIHNKEDLFKKIKKLSDKYHKLSFLFYELEQSLRYEAKKGKSFKELKETVKGIDLNRTISLTEDIKLFKKV